MVSLIVELCCTGKGAIDGAVIELVLAFGMTAGGNSFALDTGEFVGDVVAVLVGIVTLSGNRYDTDWAWPSGIIALESSMKGAAMNGAPSGGNPT
jgi:hypothetical protein